MDPTTVYGPLIERYTLLYYPRDCKSKTPHLVREKIKYQFNPDSSSEQELCQENQRVLARVLSEFSKHTNPQDSL